MNLNVPGMLLLLGGLLLGYAAVNNKDPREVVRMMFTGKEATTPISPVINASQQLPPSNTNTVWV